MTEREYLIALTSFLPFGPARARLIIKYFGTARNAWSSGENELLDIGLSVSITESFKSYKKTFDFQKYFAKLKRHSIDVLTLEEEGYPANLKELPDAPLALYVRGRLEKKDKNSIAIVGSRKMTLYGKEVTRKFASELGNLGITIVSGLAFGVDLESHKASLEAGGRCIAVLAGGVDVITPRSNEWLGLKIIKSGGAILSEFPPGVVPQKYFFPYRNRIISGLSRAVIVTEGAIKSGTIHTVKHALEQGRTVFAVPGPITSPMSQAPLYLIKNGARVLTETKDILEELDMQLKVDFGSMERVLPSGEKEVSILKILESETLHIDEIGRMSRLTVSEISAVLTTMELKGLVKNIGNGVYKKI